MSQNLRKHSAFVLLDGIEGRINVDEITDLLIDAHVIEDDPDDYRSYQIMQARELIRAHRKSKQQTEDVQHELAHLFEIREDGSRDNYYKPCGQLTPQESLQHIQYWRTKVREDIGRLQRYKDFHVARHGRKLKRLLPRDLFEFADA